MDTEKVVEKMFENFVVEKQKNLENKMHFGNMDRWKNKQCRSAKFLLWGFQLALPPFSKSSNFHKILGKNLQISAKFLRIKFSEKFAFFL